jgi:hypothetical protein
MCAYMCVFIAELKLLGWKEPCAELLVSVGLFSFGGSLRCHVECPWASQNGLEIFFRQNTTLSLLV